MAAGEGREDQIAGVGMTLVDRELVAALHHGTHVAHIRKVDFWIHPLGEHIHRQGDEIRVTGAFAVTKKRALDSVRAGEQAQFRGRNTRSPVVVGMEANSHVRTLWEISAEPLDLVGIDIRRRHFYRRREVDDHVPIRAHAPGLSHGGADFHGEIEFGPRKALRGVFENHLRFRDARHLPLHQFHPLQGEIDDLLPGFAKDHPALKRAGGIVEVEDGPLSARDGIHGADD